MESKEYIQYTIDALIDEIRILIDLEIQEVSKLRKYENIELDELPRVDIYISIIKLLNQLNNKTNECI